MRTETEFSESRAYQFESGSGLYFIIRESVLGYRDLPRVQPSSIIDFGVNQM